MKRWCAYILIVALLLGLCACGEETAPTTQSYEPETEPTAASEFGQLMILFTGDLQGVAARDPDLGHVGYAAAVEYFQTHADDYVTAVLVDGGNSVSARDDEIWNVVEACGYDIRVPGAPELEAGVSKFLRRAGDLEDCIYLSCNLMDMTKGEPVLDAYVIVEAGGVKIGFVGVTAPVAFGASDAMKYEVLGDSDPEQLYDAVQKAVDDAAADGADYVIVVGNLGTDPADSPCTTVEVIANITGLVAWLDCGSGAVLEGNTIQDKDDLPVTLCAPGSSFRYVGYLRVDLNTGAVKAELISGLTEENRTVLKKVAKLLGES